MSVKKLDTDPVKEAKSRGLELVLPEPDELLLDIDSDEGMETLRVALSVINENHPFQAKITKVTLSKSYNRHVHVRFSLDGVNGYVLSNLERLALQACLGSDRVRELYGVLRVLSGSQLAPVALFKPKRQEDCGFKRRPREQRNTEPESEEARAARANRCGTFR